MSSRRRTLGGVPGVVSAEQLATTAGHLARLQRPNGLIPWFDGGHSDPWNHVEVGDGADRHGICRRGARRVSLARRRHQLGDGSWFNYYLGDASEGHSP